MKKIIAAIVLTLSLAGFTGSAEAMDGRVSFSWSPDSTKISEQGITELVLYKDSWSNIIGSEDPSAGAISVHTSLHGCSNFWATYKTSTEESEKSEIVKVCEPRSGDPEPAQSITTVGGFKLTIDFEPLDKQL